MQILRLSLLSSICTFQVVLGVVGHRPFQFKSTFETIIFPVPGNSLRFAAMRACEVPWATPKKKGVKILVLKRT